MAEHIKRIAANGELYTLSEFQAWYGEDAQHKWQRATDNTAAVAALAVAATEHNDSELHCLGIPAPCASDGAQPAAANPATIPEHTNVHATEQIDNAMPSPSTHAVGMQATGSTTQPAATEHSYSELRPSQAVFLSLPYFRTLRAAEAAHRPIRSLHKLARDALNAITKAGVDSSDSKDLDRWFPWKEYIACHANASDIIGEGVSHAVAEFIASTRDGNRGGQPRLDFVVYRSDGTYCRLHPGSKQSLDAEPVFSPVMGSVDPATEQIPAMIQWAALPQIPFTYDYCSTIPQGDKIGKKDAYRLLLQVPVGPLPITEDASFKWWLFVCNLGQKTREVIGPGLTAATLEHKSQIWDPLNSIGLLFTRIDGTSVQLLVSPGSTGIV